MLAHIGLGRIFGVDAGLHYSWFFIALLIMFSVGGLAKSNHTTLAHGSCRVP